MCTLAALLSGLVVATGDVALAASVDSAEYDVSSSLLTVTLDEMAFPIDAAHITLTGGQGGVVVLGQGSVSHANNTAAVSIDLSGQSGDFEALLHPRSITVAANGILAISGNANSGSVTLAISYDDTTPPAISSASYATSPGVLTVTLTEAVQSVSAGDVTLTDGSTTASVSGATISHDSGTITISLDDSTRQAFEAMSHPRSIQFAAGGLADIWGNSNGASSSAAISYDDITPPAISSASYATSPGVLTVTLTEAVQSVSAGDVTLTDGSTTASVSGAAISHDSGTITISLDDSTRQAFEAMSHPHSIQFAAGGLADIWGNSNGASSSAAISYDDITPPAISSASYATSPGVLTVTLTEAVQSVSAGDVTLTDGSTTASVSGAAISHDSGTITISLDDSTRQAFEAMSHPRSIQFAAGGLADIWGNSNGASTSAAISYDDITPPAISSASYDMSTAMLTVTLTEGALPIASMMLVGDQDSILVQDITHARGAESFEVALTGDTRTDFEALSGDTVRLRAGAVYDIWNNFNPEELAASITRTGEAPEPAPPEEPPDIVLGEMTAEYDLETRILSVTTPTVVSSIDMGLIVLHDTRDYMQVSNPVSVGNVPFFVIPLSATVEAEFLALEQPRQVTVMPGGFTYLANNATNQANVTATITYGDDTTPPDMVAAQYDTTSGDLTLRFNERVLPASADHIRLDNITIGADDVSHAPNSLTISLSEQVVDQFIAMDPPRSVTITSGGITDVAGNSNTNDITATIGYLGDDSPPDVLAATYDNSTNSLAVTLSEPALAIRADAITLEYNITSVQPGSIVHDARAASFDVPLTNVAAASLPTSITVAAGGLTDVWGNSNAAALTVDVQRDVPPPAPPPSDAPTEPPADLPVEPPVTPAAISSAVYNVTSGTLTVTLTEDMLTLLEYKVRLGAMGEVPAGSLSYVEYADSFAVSLTGAYRDGFASLPLPRPVTIISGGLVDSSGRINIDNITSAISYVGDDAPPEVVSVLYDNSTDSLVLKLSEPVLTPAADQVRLVYANATASPTPVHAAPSDLMALPLDTLPGAPLPLSVTLDAGSLMDVWGNANAAAITWNITGTAPPTTPVGPPVTPASISSAVYNTTSSTLSVTLTENILALVADKILLDDTGDGIPDASLLYANGSAAFAVTLAGSEKDRFAALTLPRSIAMAPGGLIDSAGRINVADITGAVTYVGDNAPPRISSITYDNSTRSLNVTLSEPVLTPSAGIYLVYDSGPVPVVMVMHTSHTDSLAIRLAANATLPASVQIDAGSLSDIWGNANTMRLTHNVTYAAPPTAPPPASAAISTATYNVTSAVLGVTLTENVLTVLPGNIHLDASGGGVSADSLSHTNGTASFTIALSGAERDRFESLPVPRAITISPGGLVDVHDRANAANLTGTISYTDAEFPGISSASYNATAGAVSVGLTEAVTTPASGKVWLSGPAGEIAAASIVHGTDAFRITLNGTAAFEGLGTPAHVIITPGGLADLWGNANAANLTGTISYPDTVSPGISSASYNATAGVILVGLTEAVTTPASDRVWLSGPAGEIAAASIVHGTDAFRITLNDTAAFEGLGTPAHVIITPGGLADLWGNANAANLTGTISYPDTVSPGISSASYNATAGVILVGLTEAVTTPASDRVWLSGPAGEIAAASIVHGTDAFRITLNDTAAFEGLGTPAHVIITPGGLADLWGNANAANLTGTISYPDTQPPTIRSATYDAASNVLTVSFDEAISSPVIGKVQVTGPGGQVGLGALSHLNDSFAVSLAGLSQDRFGSTQPPTRVTIQPGGVSDIHNNTNDGTLTRTIDVAGAGGAGIAAAQATEQAAAQSPTTFEGLGGADAIEIVTISGKTYALVAGESDDAVQIINVTSPASPSPVAVIFNGTGGFSELDGPTFVTAATISGDTYALVASKDDDGVQIINVTSPASPAPAAALTDGSVYDALQDPRSVKTVAISGDTYALVPSRNDDALSIINVTDPSNPALTAVARHNVDNFILEGLISVDTATISGKTYALTTSESKSAVQITDISTPSSPTAVANVRFSHNIYGPLLGVTHLETVVISGKTYALAGGTILHGVQIIDISTPSSPANTAAIFDENGGFTAMRSPQYVDTVAISGKTYALVAGSGDNAVQIIDISTPSSPTATAAIFDGQDGFTALKGAAFITTTTSSGKTYALVAGKGDNAVQIIDITDPAKPKVGAAIFDGAAPDATPPTLSSAIYNVSSGMLTLTLSEALSAHDSTKVVVYNSTKTGNLTLPANAFADGGAGILAATLTSGQKSSIEALDSVRSVDVLPGGVTDVWGNPNSATLTSTISGVDAPPVAIRSAAYNNTSGALSVSMSAAVQAPAADNIRLNGTSSEMSVSATPSHSADTFTIQLSPAEMSSFGSLGHPRSVTIMANGTTDGWNVQNAANLTRAISYTDTTPPAMQSAVYNATSKVLNVTFSEPVLTPVAMYATSYADIVPLTSTHGAATASLAVTLAGDSLERFEALRLPRSVEVYVNDVGDNWGNNNTRDLRLAITYAGTGDTTPPALQSAAYNITTSALNLVASERLGDYNSTKIILYDSTLSGNVTFPANHFKQSKDGHLDAVLNSTQRAAFVALNHPRSVAILPGGIADVWGNANAAGLSASVSYPHDTTLPGLSSATYDVITGVLNVTISERLSGHDSTKIILYDSAQSGNLTLPANSFTQSTYGYLNVTLNAAQRIALENLGHPRTVAISPGGITDMWGNSNTARLSVQMSYSGDAVPPTLQSAAYDTAAGALNLTVSERLSAHDSAKIILHGSLSGNLTPPASSFTQPEHGSLSATLNAAQRTALENLGHPRNATILPGGITDMWGNANDANLTRAISYTDTTSPAMQSAVYDATSKTLNVTFSEPVITPVAIEARSYPASVSLTSPTYGAPTSSIAIALNGTDLAAFEDLRVPRSALVFGLNLVDSWGNRNAEDLRRTITYAGTGDAAPPALQSASYDITTSVLNLTMSERLGNYNSTKIALYDSTLSGNLTFPANAFTQSKHGYLTITLNSAQKTAFVSLDNPRKVAVLPGGVTDMWGHANAAHMSAAISYPHDTAPPALQSASYDITTSVLNLTMSERLGHYNSTQIALYDSALSGNVTFSAGDFDQHKRGYLNVTLDAEQKAAFLNLNHPRNATILPGGVMDIWGNSNTAHLSVQMSYSGDAAPPALQSASYDITTSVLNLTMSERLGNYNSTQIVLYDSTLSGNVTFAAGDFDQHKRGYLNATLNGTQKTAFESLSHPRNVAVLPGGVADAWGNSNTARLSAAISYAGDAAPPALQSALYRTADAVLNLTMSERLGHYNSTQIVLYDSARSGNVTFSAGDFDQHKRGYLNVTLDAEQKAAFLSLNHPRNATILPGGVMDIWGNSNAARLSVQMSYSGDAAPPALQSASYDITTSVLNLTMSERLGNYNSTQIVLYDSTLSGNVTFSAGDFDQHKRGYLNATLNGTQKTAFESLSHPRNVSVLPGGVADAWGNSNTARLSAAISYAGDAAPPALQSASYHTVDAVLNITMSERLGHYNSTKIVLYDSTLSGNVTFSAGDFDQHKRDYLNATLNGTQKTAFESLSHPRNVAVLPGGVTDIWDNANAASLSAPTSYVHVALDVQSAIYNVTSDILTVSVSDTILSHNATKVLLGNWSGAITANSTSHGNDTLTISLNATERGNFTAISPPRNVTVLPGGINGIWGNSNGANLTNTISYADTKPVSVSSASFSVSATPTQERLTVALNGSIYKVNLDKIIITDGANTMNLTGLKHDNDTLRSNVANYTTFSAYAHPVELRIMPGGVIDIWGIPNVANLTHTLEYTATHGLRAHRAHYDASNDRIAVEFSTTVKIAAPDKIRISSYINYTDVYVAPANMSANVQRVFIDLTTQENTDFLKKVVPRTIHILPGAIADNWGQPIANTTLTISYPDVTPMQIRTALYDIQSQRMTVTLERNGTFFYAPTWAFNIAPWFMFLHDNSTHVRPANAGWTSVVNPFTVGMSDRFDPKYHVVDDFIAMIPPRYLIMMPGSTGSPDGSIFPNAANMTQVVTYTDTTPPVISSANYTSGKIALTMDERVLVPDAALFRINGTNGEMAISNMSHTTHTANSTITLNSTELGKFIALNPPRHVTIMPNGTTDIWDNSNAANLTRAISYDRAALTITSAVYNVTSHILNVTFDEPALTLVANAIRLNGTGGEMPVSNVTHASRDTAFTIYLNSTEHDDFAAISLPRHVTITPNGITGIWNNTNAQNVTGIITYVGDRPLPSIKSALYNTTSGLLTVNMTGVLSATDSANMRLNDTSSEIAVSNMTHAAHADTFGIQLSEGSKGQFESMTVPRHITILPGGITGIWNNANAANLSSIISYTDTAPPVIVHATFYRANDMLAVKLDERILPTASGNVLINDTSTTLSPASAPTHPSNDSILVRLNSTELAALNAMLYTRILTVHTMTDPWNNTAVNATTDLYMTNEPLPPDSILPDAPIAPTSPTPPTISSALYNVNSGKLTVVMSETIQEPVTRALWLLDNSSEMAVSNARLGSATQSNVSSNNQFVITLNATEITSFENLAHPRNITITPGGVSDVTAAANPANLTEFISYSDDAPPSISYATFYTANDTLAIKLDERILPTTSGNVMINDSSTALATAGAPSHPSNDSILVRLNATERAAFDAMSYPRTVTVQTMTDIWDNAAVNSTVNLYYNNTALPPTFVPPPTTSTPSTPTPPDISSASYDTASGVLTVAMDQAVTPPATSAIRLLDGSAEMTVSAMSHTNDTLAMILTDAETASFENLNHPRNVTILPGGVSDLQGAQNPANLTAAISYSDDTPPSISYATFYTANDTLAIKLDERILPTTSGNVMINDSSTALATAGAPSHPSNDSILVRLNATERAAFDAMSYPRTVTVQTMTDIWDNAAVNSTVNLYYNNTALPPTFVPPPTTSTPSTPTPPDISSASYDTASGVLTVAMDQAVTPPATSAIRLLDGSAEMTVSAMSHTNDTLAMILTDAETASFENLNHPRNVTILPGGVSDLQGAQNPANLTAAISYSDDTPPSISYATFYTANDTLAIKLDERILPTTSGNVMINDSSTALATAGAPSHPSNDSILVRLNATERAAFDAMSYPRTATVQTMTDIWDNAAVNSTVNLYYNNTALPPTFVPPPTTSTPSTPTPPDISSASYDTASGVLTVAMDEAILAPVTGMIRLLDGSAEMTVSAMSHTNDTFAATLNATERATFEDLSHPRNVTVLPGGVSDVQGAQNVANLTAAISYSDDAPPSISYATFYTANDTLAIKLDERILPTTSGNVMINDSSTALATAGAPSHPSNDSILVRLNATERAAFDAMSYPRTVTVQTMTDIWDNAAVNSTVNLYYNNTALPPTFVPPPTTSTPSTPTPPDISSASYDTASGVLTVAMDQAVTPPATSAIRLLDGSAEMTVSAMSHTNDTLAMILTDAETASFENLNHPRNVTILPGGVSDLQGAQNPANLTAAISYSDDTPPSISYATFYTANDTLAIKLDERILPTTSGNVMVNDSSATLVPVAAPSHPSNDSILVRLNATERAAFDAMSYPRTVTVQTMTDIWDNAAVNSTVNLYYNNTALPPTFVPPPTTSTPSTPTPPDISSASYDTASGVLTVAMDEAVTPPVTSSILLLDGSAEMAVSTISHTNDTFTTALTNAEMATFEDLRHPRNVTILPGGVSDLQGAQNPANLTAAISYSDDTPPSISYATFYPVNDTLAVKLDERILPTTSGNVMINDTSLTMTPSGPPSHPSNDSVLVRLNGTERAAFDSMVYPRTVTVQTMTDIWDNTATNSTATLTYNNTALPPGFVPPDPPEPPQSPTPGLPPFTPPADPPMPPAISSAVYDTVSGILNVTMNQPVLTPVTSTIRLLDGSAEMGVSALSHTTGNDSFTMTLNDTERAAFEDLSHPRNMTILPGGISGVQNNYNFANLTAAITYTDMLPPSLISAAFYAENSTLDFQIDERILPTPSGNIVINRAMAPAASPSHPSNDAILLKLNGTERAEFDALPYPRTATILELADIWGNTAINTTALLPYLSDTPPSFESAVYLTGNGSLTVWFTQPLNLTAHDAAKLHMREINQTSGGITLSNAMIFDNGTYSITFDLDNNDTAAANAMATPQLDIDAGAVRDPAGNLIRAAADRPITVLDTLNPEFDHATYYVYNSTLIVAFNEDLQPTEHNATQMHVRDVNQTSGGSTLSNDLIVAGAASGNDTAQRYGSPQPSNITTIYFELDANMSGQITSAADPQLDIDRGAVADLSMNPILTVHDRPIDVIYPPSASGGFALGALQEDGACSLITPWDGPIPRLVDASYYAPRSILTLTFTGPVDASRMDMNEMSVHSNLTEYVDAGLTTPLDGSVMLSQSDSHRVHVLLPAGYVADPHDADTYIVMSDTAARQPSGVPMPSGTLQVRHAAYTLAPLPESILLLPDNSRLYVSFGKPMNESATNATLFTIYDTGDTGRSVTLGVNDTIRTGSPSMLLFDTAAHAATLNRMDSHALTMGTGAALGADGAYSPLASELPVTVTNVDDSDVMNGPVTYDTATGTLWLDLATTDAVVLPELMVLYNGTTEYSVDMMALHDPPVRTTPDSGMAYIALAPSLRLAGDVYLDMAEGAILHRSGWTPQSYGIPVNQFAGPDFAAAFPTYEDIWDRVLPEDTFSGDIPLSDVSVVRSGSDALAAIMLRNDTGHVGILNVTVPTDIDLLWSMPFGHTIDVETMNVDGVPYVMVLNRTGIYTFDLTDPASPVLASNVTADFPYRGAMAAAEHEQAPYLTYADHETWRILNVSEPSDPRAVFSGELGYERATYYDADGSGDMILGSFGFGCLHVLDVDDVHLPAFRLLEAEDRRGAVMVPDTTLVAMATAGDEPGLTVADMAPGAFGVMSFMPTNGTAPVDIGAVNLYGAPYVLLSTAPDANGTSSILVFDVSNATAPALAHAITADGEVYLDVSRIGGSAYAVLASSDGAVYAMRLDAGAP